MATNKNQHFVPRCYLRPFTIDSASKAINLFNIDRLVFIEGAPVKHQCSGSYFYGKDPRLERALQYSEGTYATALQNILQPGYSLTEFHRILLRRFWLLQYYRTDAASRRTVEMTAEMGDVAGMDANEYRLEIREAVLQGMHAFVDNMNAVDDLKVCLLRNHTSIPFITSDDPAVLTNRWHIEDRRTWGTSFGIRSAGNLFLLPLSPKVLCLGYDGDVYNISHTGGCTNIRHDRDIEAFNQHQLLNCRANIFVHDSSYAKGVLDDFTRVKSLRPVARHRINYAVLDSEDEEYSHYRVVEHPQAEDHREALVHMQTIHPHPSIWPMLIQWRRKGVVFTKGTGINYVRRIVTIEEPDTNPPFRKEWARK